MHYIRICIFVCMGILSAVPGFCAAEAHVDRTVLSVNESLNLTITTDAETMDAQTGVIKDFKVFRGGTSTRINMINGRVTKEVSTAYVLIPERTGKLTIPPIPVITPNGSFSTKPIDIRVTSSSQKAAEKDVFIRASVSEENPYEGQEIIYSFYFYAAGQVANAKLTEPDFAGFTAKEMDKRRNFRTTMNGREYVVTKLTYVLLPAGAGEKTIESAILECDLVKKKRRSGSAFDPFFDDSFFSRGTLEHRVLKTDPIRITVHPLPRDDGDIPFSGLVGSFSLDAKMDKQEVTQGDSATLSVTVSGKGNIMDAGQPPIRVPASIKTYSDEPLEEVKAGESGYTGKKTFKTALVPVEPGTYTLEPIRLRYFDIREKTYKTLETRAFTMEVFPGQEEETLSVYSASSYDENDPKEKVKFTGRDILPVYKKLDALQPRKRIPFLWFGISLFIPFCAYLLFVYSMRFFQKDHSPGKIMAKRATTALRRAGEEEEEQGFVDCLYRALVSAIYSRGNTFGESLTLEEIRFLLAKNGYDEESIQKAAELFETLEAKKFGKSGMDEKKKEELFHKTREMVKGLVR